MHLTRINFSHSFDAPHPHLFINVKVFFLVFLCWSLFRHQTFTNRIIAWLCFSLLYAFRCVFFFHSIKKNMSDHKKSTKWKKRSDEVINFFKCVSSYLMPFPFSFSHTHSLPPQYIIFCFIKAFIHVFAICMVVSFGLVFAAFHELNSFGAKYNLFSHEIRTDAMSTSLQ